MKKITTYLSLCLLFMFTSQAQEVHLKLIVTSDVHGNYFPYNFIDQKEWGGSLARVHQYVEEQRAKLGENVILIDNGDILQGNLQPIIPTLWILHLLISALLS